MKGKILTQYASHANTIADTVRAAFTKTKLGDHSVEMTAPTDSTKGGLLALQHVTLKPVTGMALVVGTVNAGEKRAELRSFAHVAKVNEERFKRPLPFDEPAYAAFLEKAESVLGAFGIETEVTDAPRDTAPSFADAAETAAKPAVRSSHAVPFVVVILLVAIVGGAVWYALHR
ncbi:MAG: hypothetical protein JWP87_3393 [Labilithrix sp.]|nr:hypothetical protein [Labilithrix sp.]